jgi:ribosomal protein S18 acetylase RimI-like enzyme
MTELVQYHTNKASAAEIAEHLRRCDAGFVPRLSERVDIDEYAIKIVTSATRFEAWADGVLVGLVAAYCNDVVSRIAYITSVSLLDDWRGRGIGACLIKSCLKHAATSCMKSASLDVDSTNLPAIRLYEKCGFAVHLENAGVVTMHQPLI